VIHCTEREREQEGVKERRVRGRDRERHERYRDSEYVVCSAAGLTTSNALAVALLVVYLITSFCVIRNVTQVISSARVILLALFLLLLLLVMLRCKRGHGIN
jgi:hypothetical protein